MLCKCMGANGYFFTIFLGGNDLMVAAVMVVIVVVMVVVVVVMVIMMVAGTSSGCKNRNSVTGPWGALRGSGRGWEGAQEDRGKKN